jgi:hypothetical protein
MGISLPVIGVPGIMGGGASTFNIIATTTAPAQTVTLQRITPTGANITVYWGDGNSSTITDGNTGTTAHEYAAAGTYAIRISNPDRITYFDISGDAQLSGDISEWTLPASLESFYVYSTSVSGDISGWTLPASLVNFRVYSTSVSGDISGWTLPASLESFRVNSTSVSGDISGWTLPASLISFYVYSTSVSGDISGWTLPASLVNFRVYSTSVSGDISGWTLPASLVNFRVNSTSVSGAPSVASAVALGDYQYQDCGLAQATVDAIAQGIYTRRSAFTNATPALNIGGTNAAPGGVYQDGDPPATGKEYLYEIINDPETEGFNKWTCTVTGGLP